MRATVRSTTEVNSSKTIGVALGFALACAINSAKVARNCCPLERDEKGLSHAGGELNPTEDNISTTSLTPNSFGKESSSDAS